LFSLVQFWGLVLFVRIRPYRIDIKRAQNAYEGASRSNKINYLSRANYSPDGQRLLRWFWVQHAAQVATAGILLWRA
jgi:hypothetical protein